MSESWPTWACTSWAPASPAVKRARSTARRSCRAARGNPTNRWVPCWKALRKGRRGSLLHLGPDGAGHFVKMVHNGIEYADMQLIAEAYDLIKQATGASASEIAQIFKTWNEGDLESFLIEITAEVLGHVDAETGKAFVDIVLDRAEQKGTGRWTVQNALDLGVPITGIAEATFARALSGSVPQREAGRAKLPAGTGEWSVADRDEFVEDVRQALYASKVVAYSQGFDQIAAASAGTAGTLTAAPWPGSGAAAASSGRAS